MRKGGKNNANVNGSNDEEYHEFPSDRDIDTQSVGSKYSKGGTIIIDKGRNKGKVKNNKAKKKKKSGTTTIEY